MFKYSTAIDVAHFWKLKTNAEKDGVNHSKSDRNQSYGRKNNNRMEWTSSAECGICEHFDTNKYLNIFVLTKLHEWMSQYIRIKHEWMPE